MLKSSELLVDVDYELASLLYLLNESIENIEAIPLNVKAADKASKEELCADLYDSTKHQRYLSLEIQKKYWDERIDC